MCRACNELPQIDRTEYEESFCADDCKGCARLRKKIDELPPIDWSSVAGVAVRNGITVDTVVAALKRNIIKL